MTSPTYNPTTQTVRAKCSFCEGAYSVFRLHEQNAVHVSVNTDIGTNRFTRILYGIFRCPGCERGALGIILHRGNYADPTPGFTYLESFYPFSAAALSLPSATPTDIQSEFREAELCAAAGAYRGASALLRSTLEKTLKTNGYIKGNDPTLRDLQKRIDAAAADGIITEARKKRAHEEIRSLGNDVLHEDWRQVTPDEVDTAHQYTQRILEDFYDDRAGVETILIAKKRLPTPSSTTPPLP
jgi:Domain of unknown function (DUF4145)